MSFIKPAGDFKADRLEAGQQKKRKPTWCKRCGRKHPRKDPCDLVEYQQGDEYEKVTDHPEIEGTAIVTLTRHPGRWIHKSLFEKGIHNER